MEIDVAKVATAWQVWVVAKVADRGGGGSWVVLWWWIEVVMIGFFAYSGGWVFVSMMVASFFV